MYTCLERRAHRDSLTLCAFQLLTASDCRGTQSISAVLLMDIILGLLWVQKGYFEWHSIENLHELRDHQYLGVAVESELFYMVFCICCH